MYLDEDGNIVKCLIHVQIIFICTAEYLLSDKFAT